MSARIHARRPFGSRAGRRMLGGTCAALIAATAFAAPPAFADPMPETDGPTTSAPTEPPTSNPAPSAPAEPEAPTDPKPPAKPKPKPPAPGRYLAGNPLGRYIVVLGARMEKSGQPPAILVDRLNRAAALAKQNPFNRVIVTGGNSWWLPIPEAAFMHLHLAQRGVTPFKVTEEPTAMSTAQNAQRTVGMLKGLGASGAVIVTNGFHMSRALKDFRTAAKRQNVNLTFVPGYA